MVLWTIVLLLIIVCIGYLYFYSKMNVFKKSGIPYLKPVPILGNMGPIIFNRMSLPQILHNFYNSRPKAKYFGFYEFTNPIVVICDPDLIKSIGIQNFKNFTNRRGFAKENQDPIMGVDLFSLKDDKWHQMRNLISPSFSSSKMKAMFKIMFQQTENFVDNILEEKKSVELEIRKVFQKLIIDVLAASIYGISTNFGHKEKTDFSVIGPETINLEKLKRKSLFLLHFPLLWKIFRMNFLEKKVMDFFRNIVDSTISEREKKKPNLPNMIHLMLEGAEKQKDISIEKITSEVCVFFMAAFHTSSGTLTNLYYDLALNPQIQERLQKEIDTLQEKFNRNSSSGESNLNEDAYAEINNLKFLDAVLKESMRLHTVAPILERICSNDFILLPTLPGSKPFTIKSGTIVWIPAEAIHQDPNHYNNPEKFDPDRFLKSDEKIVINSSTFMPFGIGPRNCIAYRFAMLMFKVVIFNFFVRCSVKVCSKTPTTLDKNNKALTNILKNEIWLRIEKREMLCK